MLALRKGQYYGSEEKRIDYNGLLISEYSYHAEKVDWHYHENPYFMYVLEGSLLDMNRKKTTQCTAGTLLLHNWQEPHHNSKHSRKSRGFHIEFDRKWLANHQFAEVLWEGSGEFIDPKIHQVMAQIYREFHINDQASTLSVEALVLELCNALENKNKRLDEVRPNWVKRLEEILHDDEEIGSLKNLAHKVNLHPVYLSTAFPLYFDMTLGEYIRFVKVKKSLTLLLNKNSSLAEIAFLSGFADQSHFTRCFRKQIGLTPGVFRKNLS